MEIDDLMRAVVLFVLIPFGILVILIIFFIISLSRAIKSTLNELQNLSKTIETTLRDVSNDVKDIKSKFESSLSNLDETSEQIRKSFQNFDAKVNTFEGIFKPFTELSQFVYQRIAPPLQSTSRLIGGISKAVEVFINVLSTKKSERKDGQ